MLDLSLIKKAEKDTYIRLMDKFLCCVLTGISDQPFPVDIKYNMY